MTSLRIVFVGAHIEADAPFRYLLRSCFQVVGLVTLHAQQLADLSGGIDLAAVAAEASIPVLQTTSINDELCVRWIAELDPEVLLVIGWTQLLREPVLRVASKATLGFHASLLPKYRGRAPINWALINGETETGNTLMVLSPGVDEGDIVAQRRIAIAPDDDCASLYRKVSETEVAMLAEVLPLLSSGQMPRQKQNSLQATVMPRRRPDDGLIDWNRSSGELYNWVRALTHPYPGAFTFTEDNRRVTVWKAEVASLPRSSDQPGEVAMDLEGWTLVSTRDGWLRLLSVQIDDEAEKSGRDVACVEGSKLIDRGVGASA